MTSDSPTLANIRRQGGRELHRGEGYTEFMQGTLYVVRASNCKVSSPIFQEQLLIFVALLGIGLT